MLTGVTYKASNPPGVVTLQSLSALPPYSRKPGPYGPTMSVCAKVMSRGVHNIAFSLSPDDSWALDLENEPQNSELQVRAEPLKPKGGTFIPAPPHRISKKTIKVVVFQRRRSSHLCYTLYVFSQCQTRVKLNRVFFPR